VIDLDRESSSRNGVRGGVTEETRELFVSADIDTSQPFRTFSAFIVAEVTINFKSLRRVKTSDTQLHIQAKVVNNTYSCGEDP